MSLSQFQNDRQLAVDASVEDQRRRPVYRFRIEIHNLRDGELEQRDSKSENHATIALLLGRSQSVRVDMISDPMTFLGRMDVRARGDIVSRRTIRMTDINATGCPNSFDPDRMPPLSQHSRTVEDVLTFLLVNRLNRYRFMYIDSQPLGCRYWVSRVMLGMQRFGFLRADANFSQGLEGLMPLQMLLACQWDVRMDANARIPTPVVPGLFLQGREASTIATTNEILQKLLHAGIPALQRLANVLDCRTENRALFQRVGQWRALSSQGRLALLGELASTSNLERFEGMAADDLAAASYDSFPQLERILTGRYARAWQALQVAGPPANGRREMAHADVFTHMLAAVCDMAGEEDEA